MEYIIVILFIIDIIFIIKFKRNKCDRKKDFVYDILVSVSLGFMTFIELINYNGYIDVNTSKILEFPAAVILAAYMVKEFRNKIAQ